MNALFSEKTREPLYDLIGQADLLVERHQDVFLRNWEDTAKNYADGKMVIYLLVKCRAADGKEHFLPFLIGKDVLDVGWINRKVVDEYAWPRHGHSVAQMRAD